MTDGVVAFLHVPKAGGATFTNALRHIYRSTAIRNGPDPSVVEDLPPGTELVAGHLAYGVHEYLGGLTTYLTMLREPFERTISAYRYVRRSPHHVLHRRVHDEDIGLAAYVTGGYEPLNVDNGQVRLLSGHHDVPFGTCDDAMLEMAKRNLERFAVVGLTEHFDESLAMCKLVLGWRSQPRYQPANVAPSRRDISGIPRAALASIGDQNTLDVELYRYATERFSDQRRDLGARLRRQLAVFRAVQGAYSGYRKVVGDTRLGFWIHRARQRT